MKLRNRWKKSEIETLRKYMRNTKITHSQQAKAFCRDSKRTLLATQQRIYILLAEDKQGSKKLAKKEDAPKPQSMTAVFQGVTMKGPANAVLKHLSNLNAKEAVIRFS